MRLSLVALLVCNLAAIPAFAQNNGLDIMSTRPMPTGGAENLLTPHAAPAATAPTIPITPSTGPQGKPGSPLFNDADTNHDGTVTKQEFLAKAEEHFNLLDKNHDGQLAAEEGDTARSEMMQNWQAQRSDWEEKMNANGIVLPQPAARKPTSSGITRPTPPTPPTAPH